MNRDFDEALYNQQKDWEAKQEFLDSEDAKAEAETKANEERSMIPKGKYCEGCPYLDTMLHYSCQLYKPPVLTDGGARHLKNADCLAR